MDRSVDSIGSCSLDVDADSTDFSDTSGELNFLTPISGKDITREFTAGIKERCMLPVINCQAVTSVLDPVTGHISTVLTTTTAANSQQQQQPLLGGGDSSPTAATNKKPSYLNLACCVNGYSNLTTYDSKLRQDINKSREVSPSRPIIATLHYNRTDSGTGGHLLTAPTLSYVSMNNTINNNNNYSGSATGIGGGGNRMLKMNGAGVVNGGGVGRMRGINGSVMSPPGGGAGTDMTDNAASLGMFNGNGSFVGSMRSKVISSQSQISSHARDDVQAQLMTPKKSFIQQRVEKLYGASDVVVLNKQNYSSSERKYLNNIANENNGGTPVKMMVPHHGMAGQHPASIGTGAARNGVTNGTDSLRHVPNGTHGAATFGSVDENNKHINGGAGEDADVDSLPVLRHLRPEFRAQLQIFSPKKVPKSSPNRTLNSNGNVTHANGNTAEEHANLPNPVSKRYTSNGNSYTDHIEQLSLSREEDHRHHKNRNGTDGTTTTHRSTMVMKSAQLSSHTTRTTTTTNGTLSSNNGRLAEQEDTALNSSSRHHSNASTRSADPPQTDDAMVEQHHRHEAASQCPHSSTGSASSSVSSSTVIVEEKMRSLVVVSSTSADDCGVGRMSTSDGSSAATTTTTVPDEQNALTAVATSVIESGKQQNDSVQPSSHSTTNNNVSNGLVNVPAACAKDHELCALDKSGSGEIVNCDSSNGEQLAVTADSMRTSNGGGGGDSTMVTMAGVEHPDANHHSSNRPAPTSSLTEPSTNGTNSSNNNNNNVLDGNHFLRILKTEQKRLGTMADEVEKEINQLKADGTVVLGEDINGYILVAVGKARLLCSQKMKQFEDLCYTNLNQSPDEKFQTTGEDLRGFWDMVMLQVNNVDASFAEIDSFRENGWRKPIPKSPPPPARNGTAGPRTKLVKRPYKTQTTASNGGSTVTVDGGSNGVEAKKASAALAAAKREAQRKQLMEMKRKQKLANSQQQPAAVEIFAPANEEQPARNGDDSSTVGSVLVDTS